MIKRADLEDIEAIIPILLRFYGEVGTVPLDVDKMSAAVVDVIGEGICLLATEDEGVIGILGLMEEEVWYSRSRRIINAFFYVSPDSRHADVGRALLFSARAIAQERGSLLEIDVINTGRKRGRVAEKLGFVPVGYLTSFGGGHVPFRQQRHEDDFQDQPRQAN